MLINQIVNQMQDGETYTFSIMRKGSDAIVMATTTQEKKPIIISGDAKEVDEALIQAITTYITKKQGLQVIIPEITPESEEKVVKKESKPKVTKAKEAKDEVKPVVEAQIFNVDEKISAVDFEKLKQLLEHTIVNVEYEGFEKQLVKIGQNEFLGPILQTYYCVTSGSAYSLMYQKIKRNDTVVVAKQEQPVMNEENDENNSVRSESEDWGVDTW